MEYLLNLMEYSMEYSMVIDLMVIDLMAIDLPECLIFSFEIRNVIVFANCVAIDGSHQLAATFASTTD